MSETRKRKAPRPASSNAAACGGSPTTTVARRSGRASEDDRASTKARRSCCAKSDSARPARRTSSAPPPSGSPSMTSPRMYLTDYRVNGKRSLRDAKRHVETLRGVFGFDKALDITADRIAAYTAARPRRTMSRPPRSTASWRRSGACSRLPSVRGSWRAGRPSPCSPRTMRARASSIRRSSRGSSRSSVPGGRHRGRRGGVRLPDVPAAWQRGWGIVVLVHLADRGWRGHGRQRAASGRRHEEQAAAAARAEGPLLDPHRTPVGPPGRGVALCVSSRWAPVRPLRHRLGGRLQGSRVCPGSSSTISGAAGRATTDEPRSRRT